MNPKHALSNDDPQDPQYRAYIRSSQDYYPFGLRMQDRQFEWQFDNYRFGFNGKERDSQGEWRSGTVYDYGLRHYDPTIGRFLRVDPVAGDFPWVSPYNYAENSPIANIDLHGLQKEEAISSDRISGRQQLFSRLAEQLSRGNQEEFDSYNEAIEHGFSSLKIFTDKGVERGLSSYSLFRYFEGEGGYDVYDVNFLKEASKFDGGYRELMREVKEFSRTLFDDEITSSSNNFYIANKQSAAWGSDFGTSIGSHGFKAFVEFSRESGDDSQIRGTAYFTFVDTYRYDADRWTVYGGIAGNHSLMVMLQDLGAKDFSIRSYFTVDFTIDKKWYGLKMNYPEASSVENATPTNHPEISIGAGYQLIDGGLKNNFTDEEE